MELIHKYFPNLSNRQTDRLSALGNLYNSWNRKINLVSRNDIPFLYERHILHSLGIAKFFKFNPGTSILDAGTGGGFPGIPLAILFENTEFLLVDSIGKKITVVNDIIHHLELKNCKAVRERVENIPQSFDFVVSRAVTRFDEFVRLIRGKIQPENKNRFPNGIIYLKGGDFENEIKSFREKITIFSLNEVFQEEFFETKKIIYMKF